MPPSQLQIGVVAAAFSADPREAARQARIAGFRGLQLDAVSSALDVTTLSQTGRRDLRHVLASNDQQLIGLRTGVGPRGFAPGADIDRLLGRARQMMEAAKGLGSPLLCLDVGPLPQPPRESKPAKPIAPEQAGLIIVPSPAPPPPQQPAPADPDPSLVSAVDSALTELGVLADRIGCTVAPRSDLSSFAALERALAAARCPWFGVDLDPVAILRDDWGIDEIFSRLGPLIRHVRARDATAADHRSQPAPIGRGSTNWPDLLAALDSAAYTGWLTIDPTELADRPAAATAGLQFLLART